MSFTLSMTVPLVIPMLVLGAWSLWPAHSPFPFRRSESGAGFSSLNRKVSVKYVVDSISSLDRKQESFRQIPVYGKLIFHTEQEGFSQRYGRLIFLTGQESVSQIYGRLIFLTEQEGFRQIYGRLIFLIGEEDFNVRYFKKEFSSKLRLL